MYLCRHTHTYTHQCESLKHLPTNKKHRSGWDSKPQSSRHLSGLSCWPIHVKYIASKPCFKYYIVTSLSCRVWDSEIQGLWVRITSVPIFFFFFVFIKFLVFSLKKKSHSVILSFIHSFIHLFRQTYIQADTHIHTLTNIHVGFHLRSQTPIGLPKS